MATVFSLRVWVRVWCASAQWASQNADVGYVADKDEVESSSMGSGGCGVRVGKCARWAAFRPSRSTSGAVESGFWKRSFNY